MPHSVNSKETHELMLAFGIGGEWLIMSVVMNSPFLYILYNLDTNWRQVRVFFYSMGHFARSRSPIILHWFKRRMRLTYLAIGINTMEKKINPTWDQLWDLMAISIPMYMRLQQVQNPDSYIHQSVTFGIM